MKLELKHITPYLPYKLKILNGWGDIKTMNYTHLDDENNGFISQVIPILRPLSDLTKEIEVNREKFVPIIEMAKIQYPKVDFEIIEDCCLGRLNAGVFIEFVIDNEIPFYKEYHNNIFGQRKQENYDDMFLANLNPSEIREKLLEWHFDVFGLIENGLAIDINTLNK